MANKTNEIGDIVKKSKILLLDIEGTTTSISFVKEKLFPYASEHVKKFLEDHWEREDVKEAIVALRKRALVDVDCKLEGAVELPGEDATKDELIEGVVANVNWQMSLDRKAGPLKLLQGMIWQQGYDKGDIKGHVFDDVAPALQQWRGVEAQKVYIFSSGSIQAQKLLFGQSTAGDLLKYIDGHFDTTIGAKQESVSYERIAEKIGCKPDEMLFLTDILIEAEMARVAGLHVAMLAREGNAPLSDDVRASYPVLQSFAELVVTNKRKPDAQDEPEQPAKMPKTDIKADVITASNEETSAKTVTDKMEVEDEPAKEKTEEPKVEEPKQAGPVIEEITDSNEPVDAIVCTKEPIVEEKSEEEKVEETEKMDTAAEAAEPTKENGSAEAPVAEDAPPVEAATEITEIEEVTEQKPDVLPEIEDIVPVPVVEEPQTDEVEMAELQNVGEVLEKECDEILSKVQDVTNLDSIAVKPMLNTISEENMETENLDTNDIVERILDSEQEREAEMKQSSEAELNIVPAEEAKEEKKTEVTKAEAKVETLEPSSAEKSDDTKTEETKVEESSPKESTESIESTDTAKVVEETTKAPETKSEDKPESSEKEVPIETQTKAEEPAAAQEKPAEPKPEEPKLNGNATNGNGEAMNGDAAQDEAVNSRLAAENGNEAVNGANGKTNGSGDDKEEKVEPEVTDIKVKTVAAAETRTDPIEQATEA